MEKLHGILGALFIIVLFAISAEGAEWKGLAERIKAPRKMIKQLSAREVFIGGRWKTIASKSSYPKLAQINATRILCYKQERVCKEATAELFTPEDGIHSPSILATYFEYKILDWSDNAIRAKCEEPIADIELKISVKDNFAERSFRETKARGVDTSDPNVFEVWVLE